MTSRNSIFTSIDNDGIMITIGKDLFAESSVGFIGKEVTLRLYEGDHRRLLNRPSCNSNYVNLYESFFRIVIVK